MALDFFTPTIGDVSLVPVWPHAGAPTNGTSGTLAGYAQAGDLLVDTTNKVTYQNTNTQASPTWASLNGSSLAINGGTIDGSILGSITPINGLTATGTITLDGIVYPATGVSGGIPYYSTTTALSASPLLAAHGVVVGGGAGAAPATLGVGATGTILAGTTGANPAFTATPSGLTSIEATTVNAGLATGTAGTVTVFPGTTTTGSTTLTATANSGNTVTNINTAAQAGARTYTVPDAGGSASFLLTVSAGTTGQILTGVTGAAPAFSGTPSGLTSIEATTVTAGLATGTAGTIQVFPGTTTTGSTTLTATANSGNTTTNINTAAQAGARTLTVPDPGGNANFLMTGATQSATTGLTPTPLLMANMKTAAGLQMTGAASGTNFGLVYTPGTGNYLTGTATASNSTSDVASYDLFLPPNYIAGTNITLTVTGYYTNTSSTASVHTMTCAAYLNAAAGTQGSSLIATGALALTITTPTAMVFTITGATLVPGSYLTLTFTANMTNGGGASTAFLTYASIT
jgi:hypothetical protein